MIRVALVDHHRVVRAGLTRILGEMGGIDVVAAVAEPDEVAPATIDVAVVSPSPAHPATSIDGAARLVAGGVRVLALLADPTAADVRAAIGAGATGLLAKTSSPEELAAAIRRVAAGERAISPDLAHIAVQVPEDELDELSHRESEVLRLIALGHTTPEIATLLGISTRTVESHRHHILVKLDLKTRADLVRYALDHRLIGPRG